MQLDAVASRIASAPHKARRRLVALVGPPASGKSTLSEQLPKLIANAQVVPMDGFHLDNAVLSARGLLARKGAPETFDVDGLAHLVARLARDEEVVFPVFDRHLDKSIAGAGVVGPQTETVIVEGNYLLLDRPAWRRLAAAWDVSVMLSTSPDTLRARLIARWRGFGLPETDVARKVDQNDLPNARLVMDESLPADITLPSES